MSRVSALAVLLSVITASAAASPIQVDLSGLSEGHRSRLDGEVLERAAHLRLLQEGFDPTAHAASHRVHVLSAEERLFVRTECARGPLDREVPMEGSAASIRLEVVQVVAELARWCHETSTPRQEPSAHTPADPPPTDARPPEPALPPTPLPLELSVRGEALWRREVDARLGIELGVRPSQQWPSLHVRLGLTRAPSAVLSAYEPELLVGARWERPLVGGLRGTLGVSAGAGVHLWQLDEARGTHPYAVAELGFGLQRAVGPLQVGLELSPGIASPVARHTTGEQTLWSRTPFRLGLGLWLGGRGKLSGPRGS